MELIIKDPIHNYVGIDRDYEPLLMQILGSYEVQRLRRITQLGMAFVAYPGAEHSRFGHSLGVMHVARKILDQLYLNRDLKAAVYREEKELLSIAALVHDIGHGPFSHTFEELMEETHAEITIRMLKSDTEIHSLLSAKNASFPEIIGGLIKGTHQKQYLGRLISGQLDADRLDYVLRDATMCGVKYGIFDLDRIIHTLRLKDGNIIVSAKGQGAVEEYLLARYFMYWHVYFHKTIMSLTKVFINALRRAWDLFREDKINFILDPLQKFFSSIEKGKMDVTAYTRMDDSDMRVHLKQWMYEPDPVIRDLSSRFIKRRPFKMVVYNTGEEADRASSEIANVLENREMPGRYYLLRETPRKNLYNYYTPEGGKEKDQNIYIESLNGEIREISSDPDSIIKNLLHPAPERIFLFFPAEIADDLKLQNII